MSEVLDAVALERLLETLAETSGYDFRGYKHGALARRVRDLMERERVGSLEELERLVAADRLLRERVAFALVVNPSLFFRDPAFWEGFRTSVIPVLRTYPSVKAWTPACGSGEEAYTLAIVLEQAGLLRKALVYATPQHPYSLEPLRSGLYLPDAAPSPWCDVEAGAARMKPFLVERIVASVHNLVTDGSPNEFNVIVCRDVLGRFDAALQDKVLNLFASSLCPLGLLALGAGDPRPTGPWQPLEGAPRVYRRIG